MRLNVPKAIERTDDAAQAASRFLARISDRYVSDRKLGQGGMGVVYLARDAKLGRPVAIKILHPEIATRIGADRFLREVRLTASLQHPHILPVLDSGCSDGVLYYIMPYLSEGSLHGLLAAGGRIPPEDAVRIALDVLEALEHAHGQGVVHCDIKPENILLSNGHALLADFGVARTMGGHRTGAGFVSGSPYYMSPEQASGDAGIDGRSDLYSLGCVLFEMLEGRPPFQGDSSQAIIAQRFRLESPSLERAARQTSREVRIALAKAMQVDPSDRFTTAEAFGHWLQRGTAKAPKWRRRHRPPGLRPTMVRLLRNAMLAAGLLAAG